ncbi:beta-lactamase/transpeptidase-like protein [Clavulina sp. PMI_390]|nr:beta-lactamase/transpeptidase-like protein [Clavulina sp. PMI_390]
MLRFLSVWVTSLVYATALATQIPLGTGNGYTSTGIRSKGFDQFVNTVLEDWGIQGLSIAVVSKDSSGAWKREYKGWGASDRDGSPITQQTMFNIASNTKLFTALAVGLLVDNGSFVDGWNTRVRDIIPEWHPQDRALEARGTLVDILSHRTGLPRHDLSYYPLESTRDVVLSVENLKASAEFRDVLQYNNIMYITAAYIVELTSGLSFPEFVERHIMRPIGMVSSTSDPLTAFQSGELAEGFLPYALNVTDGIGWQRNKYHPIPYWCDPVTAKANAGAGGIIANAEDLATWVHALLLNGRNPSTNVSVLPEGILRHVTSGYAIYSRQPSWPETGPSMYGHGQIMTHYQGHRLIEHGGATPGFRTQISRFPDDDLGIIILSNSETASYPNEIIKFRIAEEYLGLKQIDWSTRIRRKAEASLRSEAEALIPPSSSAPPPSLPVSRLAGKFTHPAYGTAELTFLRGSSHTSTSPHLVLVSSLTFPVSGDRTLCSRTTPTTLLTLRSGRSLNPPRPLRTFFRLMAPMARQPERCRMKSLLLF